MRKIFLCRILFSAMAAMIFLTGCNNGSGENSVGEISAAESSVTESASETASEEFPEIPETTAEAGQETVAGPKGYEPYQIKLYNSLGTGIPRPENYGEDMTRYYIGGELDNILPLMKDRETAEKIRAEADQYIDMAKESYHLYDSGSAQTQNNSINTYCYGYNGYLFCDIHYNYISMSFCTVFDLRTGERLELSDLFFEGEEFLGHLNQKLYAAVQQLDTVNYNYFEYIPAKREFAGLTENGFYFDDLHFYLPVNNPYLTRFAELDVSVLDFDTVLNVPYDMTGLFEEGAEEKILMFVRKNNIISSSDHAYSRSYDTGNIKISLFDGLSFLTEEQENFLAEQTLNIIETKLDGINKRNDWIAYTDKDEPLHKSFEYDEKTIAYDKNYVISSGVFRNSMVYICFEEISQVYEKTYNLYFDIDTLEPLGSEEIFERVYGDTNLKWDHVIIDIKDGSDYNERDKFFEENPPDIKSIEPEDITFKYSYSSGNLSYYEKTEDYVVWWRAEPEQEK